MRASRRIGSQAVEHGAGAVDVGLEVVEIGVRVAILLAGDLRGADLVHQALRPVRDLRRLVVGRLHERDELARRRCRACRRTASSAAAVALSTHSIFSSRWKPVHVAAGTSPARASICGIEVAERLGDGLDPLVRLARGREQLLRLGDVAGADRVRERRRARLRGAPPGRSRRPCRRRSPSRGRGIVVARDRVAGHGERAALLRRPVRAVELVRRRAAASARSGR